MFDFLITNGTVVGREGLTPNQYLAISNGTINLLTGVSQPPARETMNAEGLYIAPGFIDLHLHGGAGADVLDATPEAITRILDYHSRLGTTGLLLTIAASPTAKIISALETVIAYAEKDSRKLIQGVHLEGPYLNPSYKGAINGLYLKQPDPVEAAELLAAGQGTIRLVTLAPELPGAINIVELLSSHGVITSLGHSGATLDETDRAKKAGLRHITHIFNAMAGFHHREPGPAGAAISSGCLTAEAIADGNHLHPMILKMLWSILGKNLVLISDAISAAGLPDGRYWFNGQTVTVTRGVATLSDGRLAGSTLTLLGAVKNMIELGLTLPEAVQLASTAPARILGLTRKGLIETGNDADIVLLDSSLDPAMVMVGGKVLFRESKESD